MTQTQAVNPLLNASTLRHRAVPFPEIKPAHYLPALEQAIARAKSEIDQIKNQSAPANFANTVLALENTGEQIDYVSRTFFNQLSANTNDELQALAPKFGPMLSAYSSDILLDEQLFARIQKVYAERASLGLDPEQSQLLENTYQDFIRNGANLAPEAKEELRQIDKELSQLFPRFSENVLKATNSFQLFVDDEGQLKGLPEAARRAAALAAEERGQKGRWLFTLHMPSYEPVLKYAEDRELREKLWRAVSTRAFGGEFDNQQIIFKIVNLRHRRAHLLGFKTHAEYVLQRRMAESPTTVERFLNRLFDIYKPAAERDVAQVQALARELGGPDPLQPWDFLFYSEKLKERTLKFNDEDLRPYFPLERTVDGVFEIARRLYGLVFKPTQDYPVYHPDVRVFEVWDSKDNAFIGLFYADFFPRPSKNAGAWMTNYHEQGEFLGESLRPHVAIVCNFTKPLPDKPSLLTFREVRTLFHEFGHALHSLLSNCRYRSLAGTNVFWDFVELPSQVMENWALEKESLDLFARHFETGAAIPESLIEKIKASARFLAGYSGLRQLNFALLDMAWHNHPDPASIRDVSEFETQATRRTAVLPQIPGTNVSCAFGHIFAGGYAGGYYSYKWAEVLDADAYELFKERGPFDSFTAQAFRQNVLSRGGTEHPMQLYKRFRGREPDPEALLRREGLLSAER